jgi:hypothetical protein
MEEFRAAILTFPVKPGTTIRTGIGLMIQGFRQTVRA